VGLVGFAACVPEGGTNDQAIMSRLENQYGFALDNTGIP